MLRRRYGKKDSLKQQQDLEKPLQYCKVISLQLIKKNEKKKTATGEP